MIDKLFSYFFEAPSRKVATKFGANRVVSISSGVNHLSLPTHLRELLHREIDTGTYLSSYTSPLGHDLVRSCIAVYENRLANMEVFNLENIAITLGSTEGIFLAFLFLVTQKEKTSVLTLGPQYPLIFDLLERAGFRNIQECINDSGNRFLPSSEEVVSQIATLNPDVLFISVPNNPTGEQYSIEDFTRIVDAAINNRCYIVIDQISTDLSFHPRQEFINYIEPLAKMEIDRIIRIDSLSKKRGFSGARFGYVMSSDELTSFIREYNYRHILCPVMFGIDMVSVDIFYRSYLWLKSKYSDWDNEKSYNILIDSIEDMYGSKFNCVADCFTESANISSYQTELNSNVKILFDNEQFFRSKIGSEVAVTDWKAGFNFMAKLPYGSFDQYQFAIDLFETAGLRSFPEACFVLNEGKNIHSDQAGIWTRISVAEPSTIFEDAISRLDIFLRKTRI